MQFEKRLFQTQYTSGIDMQELQNNPVDHLTHLSLRKGGTLIDLADMPLLLSCKCKYEPNICNVDYRSECFLTIFRTKASADHKSVLLPYLFLNASLLCLRINLIAGALTSAGHFTLSHVYVSSSASSSKLIALFKSFLQLESIASLTVGISVFDTYLDESTNRSTTIHVFQDFLSTCCFYRYGQMAQIVHRNARA